MAVIAHHPRQDVGEKEEDAIHVPCGHPVSTQTWLADACCSQTLCQTHLQGTCARTGPHNSLFLGMCFTAPHSPSAIAFSTSNYSELNVSSQGCGEQRWDRNAQHMFILDRKVSMCLWEVKVKDKCINRYIGNIKHVDTCKYHEQYINFSGVSGHSPWFDAIWKAGDSVCQLIWFPGFFSLTICKRLISSFFLLICILILHMTCTHIHKWRNASFVERC